MNFKISKIPPTVPKYASMLKTYLDYMFWVVEGKIQIWCNTFSFIPYLFTKVICIWLKETKVSITDLKIWK